MQKKFLVLLISLGFLLSGRYVFAKGDDLKSFNSLNIWHRLTDNIIVFIQPDLRINDDIGNAYYYHSRQGIKFVGDYADAVVTYRFKETENGVDQWKGEHRLELELNPKWGEELKFYNRNRLEYRALSEARDRWRLRNMLKVTFPVYLPGDFQPYISEEIFYDFEIDKINLNWATLGASVRLRPDAKLSIYYRTETARIGSLDQWDTHHIIGTSLSIEI